MINQFKEIIASGKSVIKKSSLLKKRLDRAVMAVDDINQAVNDAQDALDRWSFKNQPALNRIQDILKNFK